MTSSTLSESNLCGFTATWSLDKKMFKKKGGHYKTETKTVHGMPEIEWHLKGKSNGSSIAFYLYLKSERGIKGIITCLDETVDIGLFPGEEINHYFDRIDCDQVSGRKYEFKILHASFSYRQSYPQISNPADLCIRLQQNSAEDFAINIDNKKFMVHKFILAAESPVFKRMFESDFKEAKENKVTITDSSVPVVEAFIDYCYGRDISTFFDDDTDIIDLFYFSNIYDCQTLKPQIETYLAAQLTSQNISLYVTTAEKANALQLRQACIEFVRNLIVSGKSLSHEEMASFDVEFMKDVFAFNCYK